MLGCERERGSRGMLGVARVLVGATLTVAGVAPAPVERREQGRRREEEAGLGCLSTCVRLAGWVGSAQWKGKGSSRPGR
jgi:hypothetical protein